MSLPIRGTEPVEETTWEESIKLIRAGYTTLKKPLPQTTEEIQDELIRLIQRNRISDQKRINQLIQLLGDDPYAKSYTGDKAKDFDDLLNGELVGIGISIKKDALGNAIIGYVYDGPAKAAGLQQEDILLRVNDTFFTKQTTLTDIGDLIQGKVDTKVVIAVLRQDKVYEYTITRKKLIIDPIILEDIAKDTTLMTISSFQTNTYESFSKKLPTLVSSKNLIIDLRNNLGGSLEDTTSMLNHFIAQGQPLYHIDTNGTIDTTYSLGEKPALASTTPIYFLTNHDTASASEIFAGVINEYYPNSHIIGTTTYGKGTVQTVWTNDKNETIKFTTGRRLL